MFCFLIFLFLLVLLFLLGMQSLTIYQRCLFSTTTTDASNQGDSKSKTSANANSDEGSKSGESHESSNAGKSVRGGVIKLFSYNIFFYVVDRKCN